MAGRAPILASRSASSALQFRRCGYCGGCTAVDVAAEWDSLIATQKQALLHVFGATAQMARIEPKDANQGCEVSVEPDHSNHSHRAGAASVTACQDVSEWMCPPCSITLGSLPSVHTMLADAANAAAGEADPPGALRPLSAMRVRYLQEEGSKLQEIRTAVTRALPGYSHLSKSPLLDVSRFDSDTTMVIAPALPLAAAIPSESQSSDDGLPSTAASGSDDSPSLSLSSSLSSLHPGLPSTSVTHHVPINTEAESLASSSA